MIRVQASVVAMSIERVYLDHNASAPLLDAARDAMLAALAVQGNASSVHGEGRRLRGMVEQARRDVAALVGADPAHVVFTSGATEAAATLLTPNWRMGRAPLFFSRLYVGATEHPCVLCGGRFAQGAVERIGVDRDGLLDLDALAAALAGHDRDAGMPLVAVQAANNETGVMQPVERIAQVTAAHGGVLVVDAVQAVGRVEMDMTRCGADFVFLSSHKMGGPKGTGAIVGRSDLIMPEALVRGGGHERGHRAGTENVAAIAGFGAAATLAPEAVTAAPRIAAMRDGFEAAVRERAPDAVFHGANAERLPNTSFFSLPGIKAETAQIGFDLAGIALSAGSACSSGKVGPSHVLAAMGAGTDGALRVSIGKDTTQGHLARFADALATLVERSGNRQAA